MGTEPPESPPESPRPPPPEPQAAAPRPFNLDFHLARCGWLTALNYRKEGRGLVFFRTAFKAAEALAGSRGKNGKTEALA